MVARQLSQIAERTLIKLFLRVVGARKHFARLLQAFICNDCHVFVYALVPYKRAFLIIFISSVSQVIKRAITILPPTVTPAPFFLRGLLGFS